MRACQVLRGSGVKLVVGGRVGPGSVDAGTGRRAGPRERGQAALPVSPG